tara:strand:+ start:24564 stop:25421 length:858 start_codon:yes stop_codon:yes gene_type:complete
MKIASIDIGTNAVKAKIFMTSPTLIEFCEGMRSPMRLGTDVFIDGMLSNKSINKLIKVLKEYIDHFKINSIDHFEIVATSAFRDTQNSEEARRIVENKIEHPIRIISGLEEAKLIGLHPKVENKKDSVFVDLGGGSTEFFYIHKNKRVIKSFQLGAVRNMLRKDSPSEWNKLSRWLKIIPNKKKLIGIGGNIRSFLQINESNRISQKAFINAKDSLNKLTFQEKIHKYNFSQDRADVIDYAMSVYEFILNRTNITSIQSTKWGVSDSIAVKLYHELYSGELTINN